MNGRTGDAEVLSHIHGGLGHRPKNKALARRYEKEMRRLQDARDAARAEYNRLVESGEIPMLAIDRIADLQEKAAGLPELMSTQAARRLLEKAGVPFQPANS